jgi:hypothetical protein
MLHLTDVQIVEVMGQVPLSILEVIDLFVLALTVLIAQAVNPLEYTL